MANLSDFHGSSFDIVTCSLGHVYVSDKPQALRESLRVLKPGGTFIAAYWISSDYCAIGTDMLSAVLGREAPMLKAFKLSESGLMEGMLKDAGYQSISTAECVFPFNLSELSGDDADTLFTIA